MDPADIREDGNALLCLTPFMGCCDSTNGLFGEWFFPTGSQVQVSAVVGTPLYRNRGPSLVRLNRRSDLVPSGIYRCEILISIGVSDSLYVGLYPPGEGELNVSTIDVLVGTI